MADAAFESLLNHTFSLSRRDRVSDGRGGWAVTWADAGTAEGRMRPASSAEREAARQESRAISHVLYVVSGSDIVRGDRVETEDLTVEVQGVREPSLAGHHLEIDCLEVQKEEGLEEEGS